MLHEIQLGNIKRDDQVMFEGGDWKPIVEHPELLNKIQRVETNSTARMVALIVVPLLLLVCGFMSRF